jgi:cytochrome c oxidase subunit II
MPPQMWLLYLFLALAAIIVAVFAAVAWSTRRPVESTPPGANRLRFGFFVLLSVVLAGALGFTLRRLPYDFESGRLPDRLVFVAGKQFAFALSDRPIATDADWQARTMAAPVEVPAGSLVELRVTSFDVNHSAGLFDPDGVLIAQVQAMPGYANRLRLRLDRPGTYELLCLELCGLGHGRMRGVLQVNPVAQAMHPITRQEVR